MATMATARRMEGAKVPVNTPLRGLSKPGADVRHEHVRKMSPTATIFVLVVLAVVLYATQWVILPFLLAALIAYVFAPLLAFLAARSGLPRSLFAVLLFVLIVVFALVVGMLALPPLARELKGLITDFQATIETLARATIGSGNIVLFGQSMNASDLAQAAATKMRDWIGQPRPLAVLGGAVFASAFGLIMTAVILFYFLLSGPTITEGALRLVPPEQRPLFRSIWARVDPVLRRYLIGVICVVIYATAAAYVGLGLVLGLQHAGFLALLTGLLEIVPMIGPGAAVVLAALVAVHHATGIRPIIEFALYVTALRLSIDQFFGPLALGAAARIHPVLVMFCFVSGGVLFGIAGVILAVPVVLTIKVTLAVLYDEAPLPEASEAAD
jgi:predicted PurR-regulated permease PerM